MNNVELAEKLWKKREAKGDTEFASAVDYIVGATDVLALDLPVKFHLWTQEQEGEKLTIDLADKDRWVITSDWINLPRNVNTRELYQYWIDNIYKPE